MARRVLLGGVELRDRLGPGLGVIASGLFASSVELRGDLAAGPGELVLSRPFSLAIEASVIPRRPRRILVQQFGRLSRHQIGRSEPDASPA